MDKVSIANGALIKLGEVPIQSFEDPQKEAADIKLRFEPCKRAVLELHPWKFATTTVSLIALAAAPTNPDYSVQYELPNDFLSVVKVNDGDETYVIEGNHLLINNDSVTLRYVRDITTDINTSPLFDEALSLYIAWDISHSLTEKSGKHDRMWEALQAVLSKARYKDSTKEPVKVLEADDLIESRLARSYLRNPDTQTS